MSDDHLFELSWLAFAAKQYGWDELVDRIAEDVAACRERKDELQQKRNRLRKRSDSAEEAA